MAHTPEDLAVRVQLWAVLSTQNWSQSLFCLVLWITTVSLNYVLWLHSSAHTGITFQGPVLNHISGSNGHRPCFLGEDKYPIKLSRAWCSFTLRPLYSAKVVKWALMWMRTRPHGSFAFIKDMQVQGLDFMSLFLPKNSRAYWPDSSSVPISGILFVVIFPSFPHFSNHFSGITHRWSHFENILLFSWFLTSKFLFLILFFCM